MYVIIVGGGKVGYYLAKGLVYERYEVLVIERDKKRCHMISEELGGITMAGDGCEVSTLMEAGIGRADVLIAVTGEDETNLVACQVAKSRFHVPRTIARINNPKNEVIFKKLGVDVTVSVTDAILSKIQEQIPTESLVHLLSLRGVGVEMVEMKLAEDSPALGIPLKDLGIPDDVIFPLVIRQGKALIPYGATKLEAGDEVVIVTSLRSEEKIKQILRGA